MPFDNFVFHLSAPSRAPRAASCGGREVQIPTDFIEWLLAENPWLTIDDFMPEKLNSSDWTSYGSQEFIDVFCIEASEVKLACLAPRNLDFSSLSEAL